MSAPTVVWVTLTLWFSSIDIPVQMDTADATAYEAHALAREAEELRALVNRYAERRRHEKTHRRHRRGRP